VRIRVVGRTFSLPSSVEKILWADIDGVPVRVFAPPYQFLSSGPGDLDYHVHTLTGHLLDRGDGWPVMYDIPRTYTLDSVDYSPTGFKLVAAGGQGGTILVSGFDASGEAVSETLTIAEWENGIEGTLTGTASSVTGLGSVDFAEVTGVVKDVTDDYVTLYAVDTATSFFTFLGKYGPNETRPSFRRYSLTADDNCASILALVKLRHVTLADDDDIVPIDSLQALKLMIMAIREENAGNLQGAVNFEMQAKRLMTERQQAGTMCAGTSIVLDIDYSGSLGEAMNRGIIL